ncbi:unnamed protein product [Fraxinus pennsylvanica]|uniref:Uncharacterized protein n=1 Tax=Fraxinus pennsylvanica TaxID=56036 RepID=A0AAD1ZJD9_9LAMI|nr:unnamed protein product [Fraxinus pennsylvanica]
MNVLSTPKDLSLFGKKLQSQYMRYTAQKIFGFHGISEQHNGSFGCSMKHKRADQGIETMMEPKNVANLGTCYVGIIFAHSLCYQHSILPEMNYYFFHIDKPSSEYPEYLFKSRNRSLKNAADLFHSHHFYASAPTSISLNKNTCHFNGYESF